MERDLSDFHVVHFKHIKYHQNNSSVGTALCWEWIFTLNACNSRSFALWHITQFLPPGLCSCSWLGKAFCQFGLKFFCEISEFSKLIQSAEVPQEEINRESVTGRYFTTWGRQMDYNLQALVVIAGFVCVCLYTFNSLLILLILFPAKDL